MIKNKKQYKNAKEALNNFDDFVEEEINCLKSKGAHSVEVELEKNALSAQKEALELEIKEYEDIFGCSELTITDIYDLPKAIIKARIKTECPQSELAKKIEIAEQQIQRYEAQDYNKANLERVVQIINALEVDISMSIKPKTDVKVIQMDTSHINKENLKIRKDLLVREKSLMAMGE